MLEVKVRGTGIRDLKEAMRIVGSKRAKKAYAMALNEVGKQAEKRTVKVVAKQVAKPVGIVRKRGGISTKAAHADRLTYSINSKGGYLLLKDYRPTQFKKGAKASPWGPRRLFAGTFINSKLGGNVFHRTSDKRLPIQNTFGPAIPKEIVQGEAKKVFETTVAERLPKRVAHQLSRVTKGVIS